MKKFFILILASIFMEAPLHAQKYSLQSPDGHIALTISNQEQLTYSVQLDGKTLIAPSPMGFQLKDEKEMKGNFIVENDAKVKSGIESWTPVVRNKHAECKVPYQELTLNLKEKDDQYRRIDVVFRVMNDGVAFRYTLYGISKLGNRQITKELTGYSLPESSILWIPDFAYENQGKSYKSSQKVYL